MKLSKLVQVIACLTLVLGFAQVNAQDVTDTAVNADDMKKSDGVDGWSYTLKFSGNGSYAQHEKHLTETNGKSYNLGAKIDGSAMLKHGSSEWRTTLLIDQSTQNNPTVSHFIKTSDLLKLESIYLWTLEGMPMLGPYAKATFDTSLFKNHKYFVGDTVVDGAPGDPAVSDIRLTDGLGDNPMTLKGSVGVFYKAYESEMTNVTLTAGLGAMRVWANGLSLAENDDKTYSTNVLKDFTDYGLVLGFNVGGKLDEKTSYQIGFESLTPFDLDEENFGQLEDASLFEATNYDAFAKIDTKVYDFLSLGYEFRIKKQPKLQKVEQLSNMLNVSLTYIFL